MCSKYHYAAIVACMSFVTPVTAQQQDDGSEMVITATRVERQIFDTPQAVTLITDQEIDEANESATPDILKNTEGVYVQKTNLGGGSPFIRGLTGKQVLILIDGVRLNNSFYRFGPHQYLNTIDPNLIERIEVIRGPGSVLYGSDALGGVINIITRSRTDFAQASDFSALSQIIYDSALSGGSVRLQGEGNSGDFGYILGVTKKDYGDLEAGGDVGKQIPSAYDETDADIKMNWRLANNDKLIFNLQQTDQKDVPKTSEVTLGSKAKFNYEPQQRQLAYLEYQADKPGPFDTAKFNISYNRQKEGEQIISRSTPTLETRELTDVTTAGAGIQFTNKSGLNHRFVYGLDYYADRYATSKQSIDLNTGGSTALTPGTPDGATYDSLGIYLQDEITLDKLAELILGLRYSQYAAKGSIGSTQLNLDTNATTGSIHGLYHLTPRLNLVGGVAQGFRAPNMEDFFGRVDFYSEIPNTNLKPEEVVSYDIGLKYYSNTTSADLHYYISEYTDLIDRTTVGTNPDGSPIKQRQNINEAEIKGIEAGLTHEVNKNWRLKANIAWTEGSDKQTGKPLRRIPPLNGVMQLRYTSSPRLWLELETVYADKQDKLSQGDIDDKRIPDGGTPGYTVFSLKSGYQPARNQQLLFTLENLGDKKYKTHGSGLYAAGRSYIVSYRIKFD